MLTAALDRNCAPYPTPRAPLWRGDALEFLVEDRGCAHVWRADTNRPGDCEPVVVGDRLITGFDSVQGTLAFVATSSTSLPELFVVRLGDGPPFPFLWAVIGAALFVAVVVALSGGRRE